MEQVKRNLHDADKIKNKYKFQACIDRNVILIGRSRSGKSTVAEVIEDIFYTATDTELYTETNVAIFHKLICPAIDDGLGAFFTVIDTPGFFAISKSASRQAMVHDKAMIKNLFEHADLAPRNLKAFFTKSVFFIGAIQQRCYLNRDADALKREYEYISDMRTELIGKIIASETPFNISEKNANQCQIL